MKNICQALGLIATALLGMTGCEFPVDVNEPTPSEKIVFLGKVIYQPKYATFSAPLNIEQLPSLNKINTVHIDFENQRIHFYGKTATESKCYFDRPMSLVELSSISKPVRDLEFCELQTTSPVACVASFMPSDSIHIYDYVKLHYADEYSSYCEANHPQLCNGADIKPLFATLKELALRDIHLCK